MTGPAASYTMHAMGRVGWALLVLASQVIACGRSGLDDDLPLVGGDSGLAVDASSLDAALMDHSDGASPTDSASSTDSPGESGSPTCGACADGCCQGSTCVTITLQSDSACGWGGTACRACPQGDKCAAKGGSCYHPQADCGPSNCEACCIGPNWCGDGLSSAGGCGTGGQLCQACQEPSQTCVPQSGGGGTCGAVQTCNADNCASGCCQGNVCLVGASDEACGTQGNACSACGEGQTCIISGSGGGICESPPFCTPQSCSPGGCCQGNQCMPGITDEACGEGGSACTDCTAAGEVCVAQHCVTGCSPTTCAGCCAGSVCAVGTQSAACGAGGADCVNCAMAFLSCVSQACGPYNGN